MLVRSFYIIFLDLLIIFVKDTIGEDTLCVMCRVFLGGAGGHPPPLEDFAPPPPWIFQKKFFSFIVQSVIDKQQHNSNRMVIEEGIRPGVLGPLGWVGDRLAGLLHSVETHESGRNVSVYS